MLISNSLLPITISLSAPNSAALEPAVASTAPPALPAVKIVDVPVLFVCLIRSVPAVEPELVVSVSFVSSASLTVIHTVTAPPSV